MVGGGLAGLVVAHGLASSGLDVRLFEARGASGGRLLSVEDDGWPNGLDLGARFIGTFHSRLRSLCESLDVELRLLRGDEGRLIPGRVLLGGEELSEARRTQLEIGLMGVMSETRSLALGIDPMAPWESDHAEEFDAISVDDWLLDRGYSNQVCATFSDLEPGYQSMLGLLGLIAGAGEEDFYEGVEEFGFASGSSGLIAALAAGIGDRAVTLSTPVDNIVREAPGRFRLLSNGRTLMHAGAVVVAVSAGALPRVSGIPQRALLVAPRMARNRYITAILDAGCTPEEAERLSVLSDGPCRLVWCDTHEGAAAVSVVVRGGAKHSTWAAQAYAELALRLAEIDTTRISRVHECGWANDPWIGGSYCQFSPGRLTAHGDVLASLGADGMAFAGDWTLPGWCGYMEGSVRSAERAVRYVQRYLGGTKG